MRYKTKGDRKQLGLHLTSGLDALRTSRLPTCEWILFFHSTLMYKRPFCAIFAKFIMITVVCSCPWFIEPSRQGTNLIRWIIHVLLLRSPCCRLARTLLEAIYKHISISLCGCVTNRNMLLELATHAQLLSTICRVTGFTLFKNR